MGLYCSNQLETTFHERCEKLLHITFKEAKCHICPVNEWMNAVDCRQSIVVAVPMCYCRAFALPWFKRISAARAWCDAIGRRQWYARLTSDAAVWLAEHLLALRVISGIQRILCGVWTLHTAYSAIFYQFLPGTVPMNLQVSAADCYALITVVYWSQDAQYRWCKIIRKCVTYEIMPV